MRSLIASALGALAGLVALGQAHAADISEIRIDWATYNPVSLVLKNDGLLEKEFEKDGIKITWVQSAGSNKALEFLNASSLDFGSTAGAAALIGRINGNPIKSVYVYSKPEWTALVTRKDTGITKVEELKGKSIAVTRGTDPHIFLVRALADAGLTEKDVTLVLLQHADGRLALKRGDVDAWAGLDPIMASAEIEDGDVLFHRNAANNTWGVLNVREEFAKENPEIVKRVLAAYERAREEARKDPAKLKAALVAATKLPDAVIARQLKRTDLSQSKIGDEQRDTIEAAGVALQKAGVVKADVDVKGNVSSLIDASYAPAPGQ
ncbi:aliphatic sulfonate ABC transporter substrate-binding protein [Agrobacterium rosae]|uniref:Putative aliphatic sulfonates-binding protein n=1 Tax=Agrobacterium rosae TaxID=1972867 RepID=A0AAE5VNE6_9HYPH|nr:aliphatic sulfonate ABC transporter substrate-binding protein [Agrobacterium rosae]KAA3515611.1 aliphatic sulfonate ABC transporter substrate-binding protein [Agrobacterium rosae]KAA3524573.1 aliphatic sulfonate ABC transporter substrate-binding protein [Agrobacterium rosae]MCM2431507.1 aliphatic sulfonate ABC transporter substrate-binding protein [Agrobacterium rosae]MDX8328827.1 aliphatic sulfonate ABC transporter substrate-binding protein [Agrobacterium rosae]MQB46956.1 aliphatic sulfona